MTKPFNRVYQFKIVLRDSQPTIWRRIQVPDYYTFWELHCAIQDAMGWLYSHLHEFRTEEFDPRKWQHIGVPDEDAFYEILPCRREKISDWFVPGKREKMVYEYDFGDGWTHEVTLEKIVDREPGVQYPRCSAGKMACPHEGCGGIGGHYANMEILKNPKHPDCQELREWMEDDEYDPAAFNPAEVEFGDPEENYREMYGEDSDASSESEVENGDNALIDYSDFKGMKRVAASWAVDFSPSDFPFGKALLLLVVDDLSYFVFGAHVSMPQTDYIGEFRLEMARIFQQHQILPEKFLIVREEVREMLLPMAEALGIQIEMVKKLKVVRSAKSAMTREMRLRR